MTQLVNQSGDNWAEIHCLRTVVLSAAQKLLNEVKQIDRQKISLDELSILRQELDYMIRQQAVWLQYSFIWPELKSYRLALTLQIEFRQNYL
jgi:hypothetical protein